MAEQGIYGRNAHLQQREEGDVKLGDIAELHQRRFTAFHALRLQRGGEIVDGLMELAVSVLTLAVDNCRRLAPGVAGQNIGQRQILPVAFFAVAPGKIFGPAGKGNAHDGSSVQTKNVQHGGEFHPGFAPLTDR
ncbi:hypothetical protein D3C72_1082930 [compost metagenome]